MPTYAVEMKKVCYRVFEIECTDGSAAEVLAFQQLSDLNEDTECWELESCEERSGL